MLEHATMNRTEFADFVRYHRQKFSTSQASLAHKADLPLKTVKAMESAGFTSQDAQERVCRALNCQWRDHQGFVKPWGVFGWSIRRTLMVILGPVILYYLIASLQPVLEFSNMTRAVIGLVLVVPVFFFIFLLMARDLWMDIWTDE